MNLWVNGERTEVNGANVAELAEHLGLAEHSVLIEHNGIALRQREWRERVLRENDRVEFLRVAAGG